MKKYRHLFFDLDHTIWDFDRNSREVLHELFFEHKLENHGIAADDFISRYIEINHEMWRLYHINQIDRETLRTIRFEKTFDHFNISDQKIMAGFPDAYLERLPTKKHLFPEAVEVLTYLKKKYTLHLITNGFEKVQHVKLSGAGLTCFFTEVVVSDITGYKKPDLEIFQYALSKASATAKESLMIGDDLDADIKGAINAGLDTVFFNERGQSYAANPTYEIFELTELKNIL